MAADKGGPPTGEVHDATVGGIAATHAALLTFPVRVAPSTGKEFNRIVPALTPIACFRVDDVRFAFDSSFVAPEIATEMRTLAKLRDQHKIELGGGTAVFPPLSIFGHADPAGEDDYNKPLSGRRALAIFGLLTRDTKLWEKLFSTRNHHGLGDEWGVGAIQTMLKELNFNPGGIDKKDGPETRAAVKKFQESRGLSMDGIAGPATREALFAAYMDKLCGDLKLDKKDDFLAGSDPNAKGDVQGCSEFNPVRLFSQAEQREFSKPEKKIDRDRENAPNRRVMVLLFRPGTRIDPGKWPCPRALEGKAGCIARFWSDGEKRRSEHLPDERREFKATEDTFACRFYQRLSDKSPCERIVELVLLRIRLIDVFHEPIKNARYTLTVQNLVFNDVTDDDGTLTQLVPATATTGKLEVAAWTVALDIVELGGPGTPFGARMRIENLGLSALSADAGAVKAKGDGIDETLRRAILRFQSMMDIEADGTLNAVTVKKLRETYGS